MAITVATVKTRLLSHRPGMQRSDYHVEDDKGNVGDYRAIDAPEGFDAQAFLDNELAPKFERGIREQAIRAEEEAKAAPRLATKEQAVEDEKQATEDAIDARIETEVSRG